MVHVKKVQCIEKPHKTWAQASGKLHCTFSLRDECPQDRGYSQKDEQHKSQSDGPKEIPKDIGKVIHGDESSNY